MRARNVEIDNMRGFAVEDFRVIVPHTDITIQLWDDGIDDLPFLVRMGAHGDEPVFPNEVYGIIVHGEQGQHTIALLLTNGRQFFGYNGREPTADEIAEALRSLADFEGRPTKCEGCDQCEFPGIRWPASPDEDASRSWVERCDLCERFDSDEQAARYLSAFLGVGAGISQVGGGDTMRWYIERPERDA